MEKDFEELKKQYANLYEEYIVLQKNYQENTIICSMNSMKDEYLSLQSRNDYLRSIINDQKELNKTINVMVNSLTKKIKKTHMSKISIIERLEFIKEIVTQEEGN